MNVLNYLLIAFIIVIVDLPWLMASSNYSKKMILSIQNSELKVRYSGAMVVYLVLPYLASLPKNTTEAFLLGSSVYAVYDFTNYSIFNNYSLRFAILDSIWGGILFAIVHSIIDSFKLKIE